MRKSIVIYYSQAGSTKKIAQAVYRGMKQVTAECRLAKIKDVKVADLKNYDLIGLGAPGWHSRPADPMVELMESLPSDRAKHYFFFCTHGSMPGPIIPETVAIFKKQGLTVIGAKAWYGSVSLPYMPKPFFTDGHPDAIDLKEAEDFGKEIVELSQKIAQGATELIGSKIDSKGYSSDAYVIDQKFPVTRKELSDARSQPFKVNKEKCTQCMLCVKNCPSKVIEMSDNLPVFKTTACARCWYCEQICPTGAIEYDWEAVTKAMAKYDGTDKIVKELEEAEAKGYFRRLVPLKEVGFNTQWYKVSKHPRLKVP